MEDVRSGLAQVARNTPVANNFGAALQPYAQGCPVPQSSTILDRVNSLEVNAGHFREVVEKNISELYQRLNDLERLVRG